MLLLPEGAGATRPVAGFLSKYAAFLDMALRIGDVVIVITAALLSARLRFADWGPPQGYPVGMVRAALLTALIFPAWGLYRSWRGAPIRQEMVRITLAWTTVALGLLALEWATKSTAHYSRLWMGAWYLVGLFLVIASRLLVRGALGIVRSRGLDQRKVVLIGATEAGQKILSATRDHPYMGLSVVGYVSTPFDQVDYASLPHLGDLDTYVDQLEGAPPDQLWVALPLRAEDAIRRLMEATGELPTQVRLVPDFFGFELINHHAGSVAGVPIITLRGSGLDGHARVIKALFDRIFAAIFLMLAAPLMVLLAIGVKLSGPGPVFYRQRRVGLDGREFDMLKFRSMPVDVEKHGVSWGDATAKTTTAFGRLIRRTSLDELPQLINVLRGELSLVGPRPERPVFVEEFRKKVPGYMHKHLVKGGMTGWAQVNGLRGDCDLAERISYDLYYVQNWSIGLDLSILLRTPLVIIAGHGAK